MGITLYQHEAWSLLWLVEAVFALYPLDPLLALCNSNWALGVGNFRQN